MTLVWLSLLALLLIPLLFWLLFVKYVDNERVGIIEKRWSWGGSVDSGVIALGGEAGYQPNLLRGGYHFYNWFQYRVHNAQLVTIPQNNIGYIFARDGKPLGPNQVLGSNAVANDFQNVEAFMRNGGQRGPQRQILREGTYAINLAQFAVITNDRLYFLGMNSDDQALFTKMQNMIRDRKGFHPVVIKGSDDVLGVITIQEGPALPQGEIIAPVVGDDPQDKSCYHNNFQDPEKFLKARGMRGRQLQVLVEGTYYINRLFATVDIVPKTVIDVGYVGVVVSYTGRISKDLSGEDYKHGELVEPGCRGVWNEPILPGKYAFNTYAGKIITVPTTNIILKWNRNESGSHKYDENLTEVSLITKDAFEPSLPLAVVMHIDYRQSPLVIQRFGDLKRLVEQTLDPMVSAYFKNIGQTRTLIQLLQDRAQIQIQSSKEMKEKFARYNLNLEEVLIGTPKSYGTNDKHIEKILDQLRVRQVSTEKIDTYKRQETAAIKERELREAQTRAQLQNVITESELSISVQANEGKARYQRALQEAAQICALAEADSEKCRLIAGADAERVARVGIAQAIAIEEQVKAYGGPRFQLTQQVMNRFSEAIQESRVDVVPRIIMDTSNSGGNGGNGENRNGGLGSGNGGVLESLLTLLLSQQLAGKDAAQIIPMLGDANALAAAVSKPAAAARPALGKRG